MNQRYDFLAISLLMFTATLITFVVLGPINVEAVWRWQTLISGVVTFVGVVVAAWNVTRQMRLAARGREQDRIERELPGLRAANYLLLRFHWALEGNRGPEEILKEFDALGLNQSKVSDFVNKVLEALPVTPDRIKRDIAVELFRLRSTADRFAAATKLSRNATRVYDAAVRADDNAERHKPDVVAAEERLAIATERYEKAQKEFEALREQIIQRGRAEAKRSDILRRELEKSLAID
ncbi:hypothetical protein [Bradyrhizobium sp. CCBAU 51753]|uniref:hypothetical protein n=1 Tax=Bradyrhizobium sp. CCBAU 51753 TaxID=1325100 RepID=UPI00188A330A|nr:hypothetical protein [Bradyrhizobium sp. CCBAU 51753]QOZ26164.1 hypothetical protein XH93_23105 [Bradyrhizobium sp. CCBAU 51753]